MKRLLPYLQLMRLPALFTALADCFAGLVMTHGALEPVPEFVLLLLSTTGLYLAGMVFNDVFDRAEDARERPNRPIPSGRVTVKQAVTLGVVLAGGGLAAAAAVGTDSLKIAALLAACIFAYDGRLKETRVGPLLMGGCRFFNVLLGASAIGAWHSIWTRPQLVLAAGIGVYIVGVTIFARQEAGTSARWKLVAGILTANAGIAALIWLVGSWPASADPRQVMLALGIILLILNRRWFQAVYDPSSRNVQMGVKIALLSLITIDAVMIYNRWGDPVVAVATVLLLVPALLLGRWIPMT